MAAGVTRRSVGDDAKPSAMATLLRPPREPCPVEVVSDPEIMGGWPCVSGTRIPAETILLMIKYGDDVREIVRHYPSLPLGGIEAVRRWASSDSLPFR